MAISNPLNLASFRPATQPDVYHQSVTVTWDFPIVFSQGIFALTNHHFLEALTRLEPEKKHRLIVFLDDGVIHSDPAITTRIVDYCRHYGSSLDLVCDPLLLPGGEKIKNESQHLNQIQQSIIENRLDRHSHVVAIGGGALLDTVGLAAAISHRGIRHTRIPTTVLAQNDSGVGVKNGINRFSQKNYQGTFAPPFAVINDYDFIEMLPIRDKVAGMAEAVKVALIRDEKFFDWLEKNSQALEAFEPEAMRHMIRRCAELHMQQISAGGDPFELGSARPLDFGHWSAHKLEIITNYTLRHGEAVAIGIAMDTHYSVLAGFLPAGDDVRVYQLLERLGFRLWNDALEVVQPDNTAQILAGIDDFQEHLGGELTITLLQSLGHGIEVHEMDKSLIADSISWLKTRQR